MNIQFKKKTKYIIAWLISVIIASFFSAGTAVADSNASLWKLTTGKLIPVVVTSGLKIPSLGGAGTTCLEADNTGVISGTGSACGGSVTGTDFDVPFFDAGGTALTTLDRYFEYKQPFTYLYLKTDNELESTGALVMEANTGNNIFTSLLRGSTTTTYVLANTPFTDGYVAPIGSWGSDNEYFWIKYNTGDADWGIPLLLDGTGLIRSPKSYSGGSNTIAFDTLDGDFIAGDVAGAYTGIGLYLYGGAEQFIIGSFLTGNYYNYDNSTETNNFVYGGTFKQTFSGTEVGFDTDLKLKTAGNGIYIKEGTNATMGTCTLVVGVCTVSTNKVTGSSRIFLSVQSLGTVTLPKAVGVTARTAGTSFVIKSGDATDTSVVAWEIVEPL